MAYVGYLVTVAVLVWKPRSPAPSRSDVEMGGVPAPFSSDVTEVILEFTLNVLMFVPLSLLGAFLFDRWQTRWWVLVALAATLLVEAVQGVVLSTRTASAADVVANTLGAVLGLVAARRARQFLLRRADRMAP